MICLSVYDIQEHEIVYTLQLNSKPFPESDLHATPQMFPTEKLASCNNERLSIHKLKYQYILRVELAGQTTETQKNHATNQR